MGKWTQGSGLSSSPTSFLGVIVLPLPGLCIAVLPPAQGPTGECQGHSHASHQAFFSGPAMGSLPWGSPIFNTWRYGHTAPQPSGALR